MQLPESFSLDLQTSFRILIIGVLMLSVSLSNPERGWGQALNVCRRGAEKRRLCALGWQNIKGRVCDSEERLLIFEVNSQSNYTAPFCTHEAMRWLAGIVYGS